MLVIAGGVILGFIGLIVLWNILTHLPQILYGIVVIAVVLGLLGVLAAL